MSLMKPLMLICLTVSDSIHCHSIL